MSFHVDIFRYVSVKSLIYLYFFQGLIAVGLEFRLGGGPILNPCRTPNSKLFDGFFGK